MAKNKLLHVSIEKKNNRQTNKYWRWNWKLDTVLDFFFAKFCALSQVYNLLMWYSVGGKTTVFIQPAHERNRNRILVITSQLLHALEDKVQ